MTLLLAATATLVAIAVAVLFVPVNLDVQVVKDADGSSVTVRTRLHWLGVNIPVRHTPSTRARPAARPRRRSTHGIRALLLSPGFVARTGRLLIDLAVLARPGQFELDARVGFDDPSDTGLFVGWLSFQPLDRAGLRIRIRPDFGAEVFAGRLRLGWSRSIATMTWPVLKYMASPVVWRAVRNYRAC